MNRRQRRAEMRARGEFNPEEGPPGPGEFRCAACHHLFKKAWTDEEAWAEAAQLWGEFDDAAIICDMCFRGGMERRRARA